MTARPAGLSDEESDDDFAVPPTRYQPPATMAAQSASNNNINNNKACAELRQWRPPPSGWSLNCENLATAIGQSNLNTVKTLLPPGGDTNQVFRCGNTPLLSACCQSSLPIVKYLVDIGADVNFAKDGFTALMAVCCSSYYSDRDTCTVAEILLAAGASVNAADRHRCAPLAFAARCGKFDAVRRLLRAGATVDSQDTMGWTAMMQAASRGYGHVVRCLLEAGASGALYNINGQTAADLADAQAYHIISDMLKKKLVDPDMNIPIKEESKGNICSQMSVCGELEMALFSLELAHLIPIFHQHKVDFTCFLRLDASDLDRMNIDKVGERSRLLDGIREIHTEEWQRSSLPSLHYRKYLTRADIGALLANVTQHIKLIHASVGYVRDQLTDHADLCDLSDVTILELATDQVTMSMLSESVGESLRHLRGLCGEFKLLNQHLKQAEDRVELQDCNAVQCDTAVARDLGEVNHLGNDNDPARSRSRDGTGVRSTSAALKGTVAVVVVAAAAAVSATLLLKRPGIPTLLLKRLPMWQ